MKKRMLITLGIVVGIIVIFGLIAISYDTRVSDQGICELFAEYSNIEVSYERVLTSDSVRVLRRHQKSANIVVLMVHGAPGDLTAFSAFMRDSVLASQFDLVAYDRPGYNVGDKRAVESIEEQSKALVDVIDKVALDSQKILFLSHSYGGPIASLAAVKLKDRVKGHIMLSPVIDPISEPMFWYSEMPLLVPLKWISSWPNKCASYEKMAHREKLTALIPRWKDVTSPTIMIHGRKDWLAPVENAAFVDKAFPDSLTEIIVLPDASHFFIWSKASHNLICEKLMNLG